MPFVASGVFLVPPSAHLFPLRYGQFGQMLFPVYDLELALLQNEAKHLHVAILWGAVAASAVCFSLQLEVSLSKWSRNSLAVTAEQIRRDAPDTQRGSTSDGWYILAELADWLKVI